MDDLVQWLREQLDEDERIAKAATQGEWVWSREFVTPPGYHHRTVGPLEPGDAAFIAAHDPARVLREIEAKRQVLAEYEQADRYGRTTWGQSNADQSRARTLGKVVRLLALPYADRPGYRAEWRP